MTKEEERTRWLNQRSDKFTIVLNDNELNNLKSAKHILQSFKLSENIGLVYIAVIKHDRDKCDDGLNLKTLHYHVVLHLNKICRISTLLNYIMDTFHLNENQVSMDKCNSLCMQSRYLIHLDDFDKEQYYASEVECNDIDVFNRYLSLVIVRDIHDLIGVVKHYHYDLEEIMLNISNYDKWRKYINDLIINERRKTY